MPGKIACPDQRKLCVGFGRCFVDISGSMCSFGVGLCVVQESCVVLQWIAAGPPGKSIRERLGGAKVSRVCQSDGFDHLGTFDEAPGTLQSSGVRADVQCCKITWLEELASERNTIQAREDISVSGKIAGQDPRKQYVKMCWFLIDISGCISSFGLAACVAQECVVDGIHDLGTFDEAPRTSQSPGVRADAQCCKILYLNVVAAQRQVLCFIV